MKRLFLMIAAAACVAGPMSADLAFAQGRGDARGQRSEPRGQQGRGESRRPDDRNAPPRGYERR
ncbi:MAG: hypothetical protein KIS90_12810, partial [Phenylobacterium sp.]|nr:hypothetical protein [Phenylobacterium sp.]